MMCGLETSEAGIFQTIKDATRRFLEYMSVYRYIQNEVGEEDSALAAISFAHVVEQSYK